MEAIVLTLLAVAVVYIWGTIALDFLLQEK